MAGGIDWFRWHHGSVTDPKFGLIAKKASARLGDVLAVWAFVLESASANTERGAAGQIDVEALDFMFGMDDGCAARILDAMTQRGLIGADGRVASWDKRQPKRERDDDLSSDRVRAFRERKRNETHQADTERHETPVKRQETPREEKGRGEEEQEPVLLQGERCSPSASPPRPATGARLPADWQLPRAWGEWALAEGLSLDDVRTEAAKFADFWHAKAGADSRKADWAATWRNWIRRAVPDRRRPARDSPPLNRQEAIEARNRAVAEGWVPPEMRGEVAHAGQ